MALARPAVKGDGRDPGIHAPGIRTGIPRYMWCVFNASIRNVLIDPIICGFLALRHKMMWIIILLDVGAWRKSLNFLVLGASSYACRAAIHHGGGVALCGT